MKLFCGMSIIDVMSICLMTILVLAMGGKSQKVKNSSADKRFTSDLIVITATIRNASPIKSFTYQENQKNTEVRSPVLGVELIRDGKAIAIADPPNGVYALTQAEGTAKIMLGLNPKKDEPVWVHFFVRDRGTFDLSDLEVEFSFRNFPGLENDTKLPSFVASQKSWSIPVVKCEEIEELVFIDSVE